MSIKKLFAMIIITITLILLTVGCVLATYASYNSQYREYENIVETYDVLARTSNQEAINKGNEILNVLNQNSLTRSAQQNEDYSITKIIKDNNYGTESYLYTNDTNYEIQLDTTTLNLTGINSLDLNYNLSSEKMNKEDVKNYIDSVYNDLKLDSSYDLVYLEKFDGALWEADYQKEYDGIYTPYEAVKIIFSPIEQKIASLKVFDMKYTLEQENNITEETAKSVFASSNLSRSFTTNNSQLTSEIVFIRPNNLTESNRRNGSKVLFNNTIRKAWKITNSDDLSLYVDIESGEIIGGDKLR